MHLFLCNKFICYRSSWNSYVWQGWIISAIYRTWAFYAHNFSFFIFPFSQMGFLRLMSFLQDMKHQNSGMPISELWTLDLKDGSNWPLLQVQMLNDNPLLLSSNRIFFLIWLFACLLYLAQVNDELMKPYTYENFWQVCQW